MIMRGLFFLKKKLNCLNVVIVVCGLCIIILLRGISFYFIKRQYFKHFLEDQECWTKQFVTLDPYMTSHKNDSKSLAVSSYAFIMK